MRSRLVRGMCLAAVAAVGCAGALGKEYEYEEEIYLDLDGSATVIVNASVPALVALHGLDLDTRPAARLDRDAIREGFRSAVTSVTRVSRPWRRHGRRFVQVRLETDDIRRLASDGPFAGRTYTLAPADGDDGVARLAHRQTLGPVRGRPVSDVGWTGGELFAVRMHLPSRIEYHNAPSRRVERGNILSWEQPLRDRLSGAPLEIEIRMHRQTILSRTLSIFAGALASAVALLGGVVLWMRHKGRAARRTVP